MKQTQAVNIDAIINDQFPRKPTEGSFSLVDPYSPDAVEIVQAWYQGGERHDQVCAVRFLDAEQLEYELRDFDSSTQAQEAGYTVTHQGRCGSCSGMVDLAVYLEIQDLTTPARECARKLGLGGKKQCFQEAIGFSSWCAESWAFNARNTRQECFGACSSDYGFWNLVFKRYPESNVDDAGNLRPCLQCDEDMSGPGFKYSAGRTRRNSGIESAIPRPGTEIYPVDHSTYFNTGIGDQ